MFGYVCDHPDLVRGFVEQLIPACRERGLPRASTAIGVIDRDGRLIGGMVYHNYDPDAGVIEMSGAALPGSGWLSRETLRHVYTYPFLQLDCQMVVMRVAADDERLLRQLAAFNYSFIKIPRLLGRNKDAVLALLTKEDWIANKFCQRYLHHVLGLPAALQEAA